MMCHSPEQLSVPCPPGLNCGAAVMNVPARKIANRTIKNQIQEEDMSPISLPARRSVIGTRCDGGYWHLSRIWSHLLLLHFLPLSLRFDGVTARQIPSSFRCGSVRMGSRKNNRIHRWCGEPGIIGNTPQFMMRSGSRWQIRRARFWAALAIVMLLGPWGIPRSIYILEWIISCFLASREEGWSFAQSLPPKIPVGQRAKVLRTLIYGAGAAGLQLLWELRQNRALMCDVVGLIDDDPSKVGLILDGKRVLGTGEALKALARKHAIKQVLIAIPSATGPANGPHS